MDENPRELPENSSSTNKFSNVEASIEDRKQMKQLSENFFLNTDES
jgi:hypothetical protein